MKPTPIESTGKQWKALLALGVLLILGGFVWWVSALATGGSGDGSGVMIVFGLFGYVTGRVGGWWNHG